MINEVESKLPSLFQAARRLKNDKDQQFNFDYNGDKIPIGIGMLQKSSQINVLKTHYRMSKDRQEIRNPKKGIERYECSKFPSVQSKKMMSSTTDLYYLKNGIEKAFNQKECKISSIRVIPDKK